MPQTQTPWVDSLIQQLDERDQREKQYDDMIAKFQVAAKRAINAEIARPRTSNKSDTGNADEEYDDEVTRLYSELSVKEDKLSKSRKDFQLLREKYSRVKQQAETLKVATTSQEAGLAKAKKELQNAQDDLLALQIELNASEEKNKKLYEENTELVNRWLKRVTNEADKLNDANAFLESMNRLRNSDSDQPEVHSQVNIQSDSE